MLTYTAAELEQLLPEYTKKIMQALTQAGYEAYLVGGAVRDLLLGQTPSDYDITTNARPEQVLRLCIRKNWCTVDNLGHNYGCTLIVLDEVATEVTTFRGEHYDLIDAHKPAATWYCDNLRDDLARRDFTVNAMALDIHGRLYDYFGGCEDLEKRLLRPVGKARFRYEEDALRMLRACRFVAQLGFDYIQDGEAGAACGMKGTPYFLPQVYPFPVERCAGLSLERVRKEIEKLLVSKYAGKGLMLMMATGLLEQSFRVRINGNFINVPILPEAKHLLGLPQNPRYHLYDTWEHTLLAIDNSPRELAIRWSLLLHDLGKGLPQIRKPNKEGQPSDPGHEAESAKMAQEILQRFHYPESFTNLVVWLVAQHMRFAPMLLTGEKTLRRWLYHEAKSGTFRSQKQLTAAYSQLTEVFLADMGATHARENHRLMADGRLLGKQVVEMAQHSMPVTGKDLHISGHELLAIIPQEKIKNTYNYLLERVQQGNLPNENGALLQAVRKHIERKRQRQNIDCAASSD